jgi:drug/metabolite transporter (DMT)-like permease
MEAWISFTIFAAFMQAIRTAGQKRMASELSAMGTTLARYLFGLPFAVIYLLLVIPEHTANIITSSLANNTFIIYSSLAGVAQILATMWLIKIFSHRNFAVGTIFSKTEAIQAAVFGAIFFSAVLSWLGWVAILIGAVGVLILSLPGRQQAIELPSIFYGLLSGCSFALTALWVRSASLSLAENFLQNAALTLAYMVSIQTLLCLLYVFVKEQEQLQRLAKRWRAGSFIGVTSALGSIGWYTALTYQEAALVRSLGQIEILFTLVITYLFFGERVTAREYLGITAIIISVLMLLLWV